MSLKIIKFIVTTGESPASIRGHMVISFRSVSCLRWNTEQDSAAQTKTPRGHEPSCLCHKWFMNTFKGSKCVNQQILYQKFLLPHVSVDFEKQASVTLRVTCYLMSLHPYLQWNTENRTFWKNRNVLILNVNEESCWEKHVNTDLWTKQ